MGKYDGVISDNGDYENQVKFNMNDFHWSNDNMININKNLKFILHKSQYSDKFTIKNDMLDIDKDKIEINTKSIIPIDSTGSPTSIISVDNNDKLKLNLSSDFMTLNNALYCNLGPGLMRDDQNRISIALAKCNLKFINNQLCLDMNAMINDFNCIKLDEKNRLRLDYNADDFIKDSTGKLYLKLNDKHLKRTQNGVEINIDNDTIKYDTNQSKLISSIDKYVVPQYSQSGDIYIDQTNNKMKLNINNYVDDNVGSKVVMNTNNKIDLDIVNQQSGEIYFEKPNELAIRPSPYFSRDTSGHLLPVVNNDHGLNLNNHKLNLDVSTPITFVNKKLTLDYNDYFTLLNNKLSIDINKLTTDMIIPKQNEGIKLNHDRTISIDTNVLTSLINVSALSGLKIVGNTIIVDEILMASNLIKLNSNSTLKRTNGFYEIECDRVSIHSDFTSGALHVKDSYIPSVVTTDYIKNKIINEKYYKNMLIYQGPAILKKASLCWWNLDCVADTEKIIGISDVKIKKFHNQQHKFNDFYYFKTIDDPSYYYKHYSTEIFNTVINDNYLYFNNTTQKIKFTDTFLKNNNLFSIAYNFIIEPLKKNIDINSTIFQSGTDDYIKILYDNQGIVFRFGDMYNIKYDYLLEVIIPTPSTLLNRKNVITIYFNGINDIHVNNRKSIVYVNSDKIQDTLLSISPSFIDSTTQQYHNFQLCNNSDNSQSFNGKMYDFSMLQNISSEEALNLHEYYKYIHNI